MFYVAYMNKLHITVKTVYTHILYNSKILYNVNCFAQIYQFSLNLNLLQQKFSLPGRLVQLVTCPATDACLTADPGVASSILARSHTFVEINHEIISRVVCLPSAESFKKGCCPLQAKVCTRSTG